jgi:uncharacterized protein (DUF302 family)
MGSYTMGRTVTLGFAEAEQRITEELAKVGFGILTVIDVKETLKKKLDLDVAPYRILGACNPHFASQAMAVEPEIGALLPCNVLVREVAGGTRVEAMDPAAVLTLVDRPEVAAMAGEVRRLLEQALAAI